MNSRRIYNWKCRDRTIVLGKRTLVMGILNVTPDSFSDGGDYTDPGKAVDRALELIAQGADMIDIGGESTRPGADPVSAVEEIKRTVPIIEKLRDQTDSPISIDTMKAEVALRAMEAGADIINDVSAFEADNVMAEVASQTRAGVILMHMKGTPQTMQDDPSYGNVVSAVRDFLQDRMQVVIEQGVDRNSIVIDPGIGFGKTQEHNLELLRNISELAECGAPVLLGASRKSFIGHVLGRENPADRLAGGLGIAAWAVLQGTHILRVHDVIDTCDVCRIMDTLWSGDL